MLTSIGNFAEARAPYRRALNLALAASERQALAATVNIVELDVASGALAGALQLARPLAISLRHSGRRETRVELLSLLFGALLLAGEVDEARAAGLELYELARRFDLARLYPVLDAMALLAALEGRHEVAARISAGSESAHLRHGQTRRRPAGERIRENTREILDRNLGTGWRRRHDGPGLPDEAEACALALEPCSPGR
jgi:hypothetical protein